MSGLFLTYFVFISLNDELFCFLCRKFEVFDVKFSHTSEAIDHVFDSRFRCFTLMHKMTKTFEKKNYFEAENSSPKILIGRMKTNCLG